MENPRLKIIATDNSTSSPPLSNRKMQRNEQQARLDRLWLVDKEHLDPLRNSMERERIARTIALILESLSLSGKKAADLGCGSGVLTRMLRDGGAKVDAVDISGNALKILKENTMENLEAIQDYVPMTILKDDAYDLVVSTELIAWLPEDQYRLYFSELARLVKFDGHVVCSTLIDISSEDALQRFVNLAETEFDIEKWVLSHHLCYIRIADFFKAPSRFVRASHDGEYRQREINRRFGFGQTWFRWNSSRIPAFLWVLIQYPLKPIVGFIRQNRSFLLFLEKICNFLWSTSGISHAIFIGKRRPMAEILPSSEIPKEHKHKKQVWE